MATATIVPTSGALGVVSHFLVAPVVRVKTPRTDPSLNYLRSRLTLTSLQGSYFLSETLDRSRYTTSESTSAPETAAVSQLVTVGEPERMLAAAGVSGYIWPFTGNISQYFSDYHDGIDIDAVGRYGDPVVAAALGEVVLVSWQEEGLGYHVIIRHRDGSETVYAHLSDVYVWQGQFVGRGQAIGAIGCTGYCTGPHLHFEISIGGFLVDPLGYLP